MKKIALALALAPLPAAAMDTRHYDALPLPAQMAAVQGAVGTLEEWGGDNPALNSCLQGMDDRALWNAVAVSVAFGPPTLHAALMSALERQCGLDVSAWR